MEKHQLHKKMGVRLRGIFPIDNAEIHFDPACGGKQRIPLYMDRRKGRTDALCDVDLLIVKDKKVKVIIEIEESGFEPTKICGKYLTSALAKSYINAKNDMFKTDENTVLFIEIIGKDKMDKNIKKAENSVKTDQFKFIEKSINEMIKNTKYGCVKEYKMYILTEDNFESEFNKIMRKIKDYV